MSECTISFSQKDISSCDISISLKLLPTVCFGCNCDIDDAKYKARLAKSFPHLGLKSEKERLLSAAQKELQRFRENQKPYSGEAERLLCKPCLVQKILTAKFNNSSDYIDCPFGRLVAINIDACFAYLSSRELESLKCRMARFAEEQNYFCYTCPFFDEYGPCDSQTLYPKTPMGQSRVTKCAYHGNRCVKCWEEKDEYHSCCNYPKSVFTIDCFELYRCPKCLAIIEKNYGCCNLACNCGNMFNSTQHIIRPTNAKVVPLKPANKFVTKLLWTLPKAKKRKRLDK